MTSATCWVIPGNDPKPYETVENPAPHAPFPAAFRYTEGRKRAGASLSSYGPLACLSVNLMPASLPVTQATA